MNTQHQFEYGNICKAINLHINSIYIGDPIKDSCVQFDGLGRTMIHLIDSWNNKRVLVLHDVGVLYAVLELVPESSIVYIAYKDQDLNWVKINFPDIDAFLCKPEEMYSKLKLMPKFDVA